MSAISATHRRKMQEGLALYRETKSQREVQMVRDYRDWCIEERKAYSRYVNLREQLGPFDEQVAIARDNWHLIAARMPDTPADSSPAWRVAA